LNVLNDTGDRALVGQVVSLRLAQGAQLGGQGAGLVVGLEFNERILGRLQRRLSQFQLLAEESHVLGALTVELVDVLDVLLGPGVGDARCLFGVAVGHGQLQQAGVGARAGAAFALQRL
jgi:hypothetical protein